jgi:transmembrane sensor
MTGTENVIALPNPEEIERQAATWLTTLGREEVSVEEKMAFRQWLGESERHRKAFEALCALWGELEILKELDDIAEAAVTQPVQAHTLSRRRVIAAGLAAVAGGAGFVLYRWLPRSTDVYETAVGEQRTVRLSDGSTVQMNTDTYMMVDFSQSSRILRLFRGEAHFDVAKDDPRRPFLVHAANGIVKAIGTAFTVRLRADDVVEVTVEEGHVSLAWVETLAFGETPPAAADLIAGQNVVFNERVERIKEIPPAELNRKLAWRQGMLVYDGEPLVDVVADISRYTDVDIEITDPTIRDLPVAGYFRVGKVDALFDSLEGTFGLKVEHVSENLVRLSAAP